MEFSLISQPVLHSMECIICAYPFDSTERLPALTECDHNNICSFCFLRMRALQKNFNCPTCKRELEHIICTDKKDALFSHYTIWGDSIGEDFILDQKSRMFLPKKYSKNKVEPLWVCKCNSCHQTRRDLKSLRGHLIADHNLQLCLLCAEHKQAFPAEQKIYTKAQYDKHLRQGDGDGGNGHPNCEFCRVRYYDSTALFVHLNKDHYTCHLCDKMGIKFKFYSHYPDLENHFRKDHFICEERACLEKQFIAFANEIDLAAHNMTWHPQLTITRTIHMNFKTHRDDAKSSNSSSRHRREDEEGANGKESGDADGTDRRTQRFEGGLGGRANEGEWQVELQPFLAGDPRDPLRNAGGANAAETAASFAAELAAASAGGGASEDFPALQSSVQPVGSFYQGITAGNKWVSIGGSNKTRKNDFPELKSNNSKKGGNTNIDNKFKVGKPSGAGVAGAASAGGGVGNVSSIDAEYAQAGNTAYAGAASSSSASTAGFGNWASVKVDKRLNKNKSSGGGGGASATSSGANSGAGSGRSKGSAPASEQETVELARALSASMIDSSGSGSSSSALTTTTAAVKPSPYLSATQSEGNAKADEWRTVETSAAAAPPPPPPTDSIAAFPSLSTGSKSLPQPPPSSAAGKKQPLAPKKNTSELSSMLKAAGVAGGAPSKKASKLTVVKTLKNPTADVNRLSPSPSASTAGYTGWATIGGAPKNQPSAGAGNSNISNEDFPGLGGKKSGR